MNLKLVSALSIVGLLVACGDSGSSANGGEGGSGGDPTTTTGGGGQGGVGPGPGPGPGPGNGGGGEGGGTEECIDEGAAQFLQENELVPAAGQNLCTPAQVTGFIESCFEGTQETCDAYLNDTANDACFGCMFGTMDGTNWPAAFITPNNAAVVNVALCESLVQELPNCVRTVFNPTLCVVSACDICETNEGFSACLAEAEAGVCAPLADEITAECEPVAAGMSPECTGADFLGTLEAVANYVCGAP